MKEPGLSVFPRGDNLVGARHEPEMARLKLGPQALNPPSMRIHKPMEDKPCAAPSFSRSPALVCCQSGRVSAFLRPRCLQPAPSLPSWPTPRWLSRHPTTVRWSGRQPKAFTLLALACANGRIRLYPRRTQLASSP